MDIKIYAALLIIFLTVRGSLGEARKPRKFYYDDLEDIDENDDSLESIIELSKPTLRTILRGLITLLLHVFPECAPKSPKKEEEGIKIFRQIVACPGHPYAIPYPQKAEQLPPELQELINSRVI